MNRHKHVYSYLSIFAPVLLLATAALLFTYPNNSNNTALSEAVSFSTNILMDDMDFGDLPSPYPVTLADDGPRHLLPDVPEVFLGSGVSGEADGVNTDLGDGDTEDDGIQLISPLIPGYEACLEFTFEAPRDFAGPDAFLNAWVDYNGNEAFEEGEKIIFTSINDTEPFLEFETNALVLENGYKKDSDIITICFDVPSNATFLNGNAIMRFRISTNPLLGPSGILPDDSTPDGEVEDYVFPLSTVGGIVWEDYNFDGIQDNEEEGTGINGVAMGLIFAGKDGVLDTDNPEQVQGDDKVYTTTTQSFDGVSGLYYFNGLIASDNYRIVAMRNDDLTCPPINEGGDDLLDNDGEKLPGQENSFFVDFDIDQTNALVEDENGIGDDHGDAPEMVSGFPDNQVDQSFDFAATAIDFGDLPDDPIENFDFKTLLSSFGPLHLIIPGNFLGTCVDPELDGQPSANGLGDDDDINSADTFCDNDDDGITLLTPLLPGYEACIKVEWSWDYSANAHFAGWIDFDYDGNLAPSERISFDLGNDMTGDPELANGNNQEMVFCFEVPENFQSSGNLKARFRISNIEDISPNGPVLTGDDPLPVGEVEDYVIPMAKVGNLVWFDENLNGTQDNKGNGSEEDGIENALVKLVYAGFEDDLFENGNDIVFETLTDSDGKYSFCGLVPGNYLIFLNDFVECSDGMESLTSQYVMTVPNVPSDVELDSDGTPIAAFTIPDPVALPTGESGIGDGVTDIADELEDQTIDFGLVGKPQIEALLNDVGYDYPESGVCGGQFNVLMNLCIKNTGGTVLDNLSATLDLEAFFGPAFVSLVDVELLNGDEVELAPSINPDYDGNTATAEIFETSTGILNPGDSLCVRIVFELSPGEDGSPDPLLVSADVSGRAINFEGLIFPDYCGGDSEIIAEDSSNDAMEMEGTMMTMNNPTTISDCWDRVDLFAGNDVVFVNVDDNCQITVTSDMLIENHKSDCDDDTFPEGGFYRVRFQDIEEIGGVTINVEDYNVEEPLEFTVRTITNFCDPITVSVVPFDNKIASIPEVNGEAMLVCTDVDTIMKYFEADIARSNEACTFEGVSWDILREQGVFDVDELADGCYGLCQLDIQVSDIFLPVDECEGTRMIRTIRIEDEIGNIASIEIPFLFKPFDIILDKLDKDTLVDLCLYPDATTNDVLKITGLPYYINGFGDTVYIDQRYLNDENKTTLCGYSIAFTDLAIPENCGVKIIRTWNILNTCREPNRVNVDQVIVMGQLTPPVVTCPTDFPDTVSTGPFDCTASMIVPPPVVDGCANDEFTYSIKVYQKDIKRDVTGLPIPGEFDTTLVATAITFIEETNSYSVSTLEIGNYCIGYNVTDDCGNVADEILCEFDVIDATEPIAKCTDQLNISIEGNGFGQVAVEDVDGGSWDNCMLVDVRIRRTLDSCLDSYIDLVLGLNSLDELGVSVEYNTMTGDSTFLYHTTTGKRDTFLMAEVGPDGIFHYYTYWGDEVFFTCCDVSKTSEDFVKVELQAKDKAGNTNICWTDEFIENKITPFCVAPDDFMLDCTELTIDPTNLDEVRAKFGTVEELLEGKDIAVDFNCDYTIIDTIDWQGGDCLEGVLTRIFKIIAVNGKMSTCEQRITIKNLIDYAIVFPGDGHAICGEDDGELIDLESFGCDVFAINTDTTEFESRADECFSRHITYTVINWCEYDGVSLVPTMVPRDFDCDGDTKEETYLKIFQSNVWIDDDASIFKEGVINDAQDEDLKDGDESELFSWIGVLGHFDIPCQQNAIYTKGFWEYTQIVDVFDNEAPIIAFDTLEFCAGGIVGIGPCDGAIEVPFTAIDSCTEDVEVRRVRVDLDSKGSPVDLTDIWYQVLKTDTGFVVINLEGKGFPVGEHIFEVTIADLCGNIKIAEIPFSIIDCKTPAPICIELLSIDLLPIVFGKQLVGGENFINAYTFIPQDITDCTPHPNPDGEGDVRYYVVRVDELVELGLEQPTSDFLTEEYRSVRFDCDDEGLSVPVYVIALDGAGLFDYCTVQVFVKVGLDPNPCDEVITIEGRIGGAILTESDEPFEGVEVALSGQSTASVATSVEGGYEFRGLVEGYDYTITPTYDSDPGNGVSTFDLVLITKHILGIDGLDSPYKLIAADVNKSGSVTTLDLIQLRKLILSIDETFGSNTSWRFIDANHPMDGNPFEGTLPEIVSVNNLSGFELEVDFVAVKIGDVNDSHTTAAFDNEVRSEAGVITITSMNQYIEAGNNYEVVLTSESLKQVLGLQFTLSFNPNYLAPMSIDYGLFKEQNLGLTHLDEGFITTSWNQPAGTLAEVEDNQLFTLHFKALGTGQLKDFLALTSRFTSAEAYNEQGEIMNVRLGFNGEIAAEPTFELLQNRPNPFSQSTIIGFTLPSDSYVELGIQNLQGEWIRTINGAYAKGYNEILINQNDLAPGVYTYQLKAGDFIAIKQMVVIE